jgi:hypothetical protein
MITTKLVGGLGNQLFQWACSRNLQKLYGHKLEYDDHIERYGRKRDLFRFPNIKLENNSYIKRQNSNFKIFINDNFDYFSFKKNDFSDVNNIYYLDGYWQGEKYFIDVADEIKEELKPSNEFVQLNKHFLEEDSLSLHIRRTDYLNLKEHHPVQGLDYYSSAIDLLFHSGPIYVFSDDIEWCKNNLKFDNIKFLHNKDPLIDIWLMSMCKKNVIANSSFSWWAAWLNNNKDKKIVCPKKWFGPKSPSDKDILDNDWIKL